MAAAALATDLRSLEADLSRHVRGDVLFDEGARALYATDASNYRQLPLGVVLPRDDEDVVAALRACARHGAPVLPRGAATSLAGQTCNEAVVLDLSRHLTRVLEVDPERRLARVQPGVVLDDLRAAAAEYGLTYGPDPATHSRCTLGGMIGNNSCGAHALTAGLTSDNVEQLEIVLVDGTRMCVGQDGDRLEEILAAGGRQAEVYAALRDLRDSSLALLRTGYPKIPRRVSGYNADALLPENGFSVARSLVGSEGTLAVVVAATVRLVPDPAHRALVVLGFPDVVAAAAAVPQVLASEPIGLEGFDGRMIDLAREKHLHPEALAELPDGHGWLLVELGGEQADDVRARADELAGSASELGAVDARCEVDPAAQQRLWRVRESALGATSSLPDGRQTWPGWEDSAVQPTDLADYLRDLFALADRYGYELSVYGHFGQGCVHTRTAFDLRTAQGIAAFRAFLTEAAHLVCDRYGGSLSGEHGDGQARAELLPVMFGDELVALFGRMKAIWDPEGRLNPGKVVDPRPLDADLRLGVGYAPPEVDSAFGYPKDGGSFSRAVLRCVGVGKCREHGSDGGAVMCPSYMVTRDEQHSTRGRARLLWEMLNGGLRAQGWSSPAVHDALDLCLMCKGCRSDCPVGVDMATYKAEFLWHHYRHRVRPRAHYSMGWLPALAPVAAAAPTIVNSVAAAPGLSRLAKWLAGVDQHRSLPAFAPRRFTAAFQPRAAADRPRVVLWPDTFTNSFSPGVAHAAVDLLEAAGLHVVVPRRAVCCGLTWVSTGQLGVAKRVLRRSVAVLRDEIRAGTPVVGLEPSCTAALRSDAAELLPHDEDVQRLSAQTRTLAEQLREVGWQPPYVGGTAIRQEHCHQHAVLGADADQALLQAAGVDVKTLDSGCCGLAGNFGFEEGHWEVSRAAGERVLLPAVRAADLTTVVLADGFSCRTQIEQGDTGRRGRHLAELLAARLRTAGPSPV